MVEIAGLPGTLLDYLKTRIEEILKKQNIHVLVDYARRKADTPMVREIITLGLSSIAFERNVMSNVGSDGVGKELLVTVCMTMYVPYLSDGNEIYRHMSLVLDDILKQKVWHCEQINCSPITYDRSRRSASFPVELTFRCMI